MKALLLICALFILTAARSQCVIQDSVHKDIYHLCFNSKIKNYPVFTLTSSTGKVIWKQKVKVFKGFNASTFKAPKLSTGIYIISLENHFSLTISTQ